MIANKRRCTDCGKLLSKPQIYNLGKHKNGHQVTGDARENHEGKIPYCTKCFVTGLHPGDILTALGEWSYF